MENKMFAAMLDCSRNAVMNVKELKNYIDALSLIGYNSLMLYTEDTYEVDNEPYFGYLRGRYSQDELKEIDAYAKSKNIELIPCIQTLAHLNQAFRWPRFASIRDCDDILLVDDERTYQFIENMFATLAKCFTSRKVNIGMDEAHMLGRGRHLDITNEFKKNDIFLRHLDRVVKIATKYGFSPMMWSDMFYRLATNGDYYKENAAISDEVKRLVPKEITLIYWDYYHEDEKTYDKMIKGHLSFNNPVGFAGGVWTWSGFAPFNDKALKVTKAAMRACHKNNIDNIIMTLWKDNGGECSFYSVLPSLLYARMAFDGITSLTEIKQRFKELFNLSFDDFTKLDTINHIKGKTEDFDVINQSKYMLYNDPFLGIFDSRVNKGDGNIYKQYVNMYNRLSKRLGKYGYIATVLKDLAHVLSYKYELGIKTREAYVTKDNKLLDEVINDYKMTIKLLYKFTESFRNLWYIENKPHGFDVEEIRLGGLIMRLSSCKDRLLKLRNKEIDKIPELEEKLLDFAGNEGSKSATNYNNYSTNQTVNVL